MNIEEYTSTIQELKSKIDEINHEIRNIQKNYCEENSKFKVGDVIETSDGIVGKVTEIYCDNDYGYIKGKWTVMKKDGQLPTTEVRGLPAQFVVNFPRENYTLEIKH